MKFRHLRVLLDLAILTMLIDVIGGEIYSSTAHIKDELEKRRQDNTVHILKQLFDRQTQNLRNMKRLVNTLEDLELGVHDPAFTVEHPLDAYRFIKNYSLIHTDVVRHLRQEVQTSSEELNESDKIAEKLIGLPSDDLIGAISAILRIQYVYGLRTQDLADGKFRRYLRRKLTATECQDILDVAYQSNMGNLAREWTDIAVGRVNEGDNTSTVNNILGAAATAAFNAKFYNDAVSISKHLHHINPWSRYHKLQAKFYERRCVKLKMPEHVPAYNDVLLRGCRMSLTPKTANETKRKLFCKYVDNGHPFLTYRPAKVEEASLDPYMLIYHDCFSSRFLSALKGQAKPRLTRSQVVTGTDQIATDHRTSKGMFFAIEGYMLYLYKYVEALTSLRWMSFEQFQVANYGIGGHYKTHQDYYVESTKGNRIATFMIYLSDVEDGGATTFPLIGKSFRPKAGQAVLWYNLYPNGEGNVNTVHSACPVITGDKWVATIWIHDTFQEFTRPCNLNKDDLKWRL